MPDKTWKAVERRVAARFHSVRSGPLGKRDTDVLHPLFAIEIKHRKRLPQWALDCLQQARDGKTATGKLPLTVMAGKGMATDDYLVTMRLADFLKVAEWVSDEAPLTSDVAG